MQWLGRGILQSLRHFVHLEQSLYVLYGENLAELVAFNLKIICEESNGWFSKYP